MQTEQDWATRLKKLETNRDCATAAKDSLLQQAMQRAQAEAQAALEHLRSDSTAEAKRVSSKHEHQIATLKV
jgi:vacuolar-type H+-ATPase subunit H